MPHRARSSAMPTPIHTAPLYPMHPYISRRQFLKQSSILAASVAAVGGPLVSRAARSPNDTVRLGIIGCNGRGLAHIAGYLSVPDAEIVAICDVDSRALQKGIAAVAQKHQRTPKGFKDLRRMIEDPELD